MNRADTGKRVSSRPSGVDPGYRRRGGGTAFRRQRAHLFTRTLPCTALHPLMSVDAVSLFVASPWRAHRQEQPTSAKLTRPISRRRSDRPCHCNCCPSWASSAGVLPRPVSGSAAPAVKTERGTLPHYGAGFRPFDRVARSALPIDRHEAAIPAGSDPEGNTQCRARPRSPIAPRTGCSR